MRKPDLACAAHLTALATILIWGTTYISTKVLLRDFTPIEILFLRFVLGLGVLSLARQKLPFRNWTRLPKVTSMNFCSAAKPVLQRFRSGFTQSGKARGAVEKRQSGGQKGATELLAAASNWREERLYIGAGLTGVTLYFLLENIALTLTSASNVGVLVTTAPFFTALLSYLFLREEHLEARFFLGFVLALTGIALLSYSGCVTLKLNPLGDLLALSAALVWAVYSVLMKKIGRLGHPMIACTRRTFFYGLLFMVPALFLLDFSPAWGKLAEPVNLCNFLFLGIGASALCFASWNWAVKILGAVRTSVYIYLVPAVTVATAVVVLDERITVPAACGMALALAGLALSETGGRRKSAAPASKLHQRS